MPSELAHYKVVLLGDSGVGKTALVERVTEDIFQNCHVPTVGAQFISLEMEIAENKCILELWDTAGQEVFRSLVGFYAREAKGAIIMYDVTVKASFENLPKWIEFIRENSPDAQLLVFGNKIDLTDERLVLKEDAEKFTGSHNILFFEGSAKTSENVRDAFEKMVETLSATASPVAPTVTIEAGKHKKGKCC
jgi:small GTP-binding protein